MNGLSNISRTQNGSMLLEALISILIFSMAILAIVGLQASSIRMSSDAKYRSDASFLATQYIGEMWADMATAVSGTGCASPFSSTQFDKFKSPNGPKYVQWLGTLQEKLPNAEASVGTATTISPNPCVAGVQQNSSTIANITIHWTLPGADSAAQSSVQHSFSTSAQISAQNQN